jgi:hypothetical protein
LKFAEQNHPIEWTITGEDPSISPRNQPIEIQTFTEMSRIEVT